MGKVTIPGNTKELKYSYVKSMIGKEPTIESN